MASWVISETIVQTMMNAPTRLMWFAFIISLYTCKPKEPEQLNVVYVSHLGTSFHRKGCYYVGDKPIGIMQEEAIQLGYEPCPECRAVKDKRDNVQK